MRKIILHILKNIIYIIQLGINYKSLKKAKHIYNKIYSIWLSYCFNKIGKNVYFQYPTTLINPQNIQIKDNVSIGSNCILACWIKIREQTFKSKIIIQENTIIGDYTHITSINKITIGKEVLTGRYCTITDNAHGLANNQDIEIPPNERLLSSKGEVYIGNKVWIGDKVTILPGVRIGDCCIIGANSVVSHDIPPYSIAAGCPAQIIKHINKSQQL